MTHKMSRKLFAEVAPSHSDNDSSPNDPFANKELYSSSILTALLFLFANPNGCPYPTRSVTSSHLDRGACELQCTTSGRKACGF